MALRAVAAALLVLLLVAACGNTLYLSSPTPSPTDAPVAPTATPVPSDAPSASPTATAADDGSAEVFFAQFGAVPPPFHVRIATTLTGPPSGTALQVADVDGADYSADLHVDVEGAGAQDSRIIVVDGTAYVADAGTQSWRAYPDYSTVPPVNTFLDLDPLQWQVVGRDPAHDELERLRSTTWRPADELVAERMGEVVFDVWIDDEGRPVLAGLAFTFMAADGGSSVGYDATYDYSNVGLPVVIATPPPAPSPSPSPSASPS